MRASKVKEEDDNFKVIIRVRPPLPREQKNFVNVVKIENNRVITICENLAQYEQNKDGYEGMYNAHQFTFDFVYDPSSKQPCVYENTAKNSVLKLLEGYNATLIA